MKNRTIIFLVLSVFIFVSFSYAEDKFFEIKAQKFFYTPNLIKVNKGDVVRIRLISEDVHHGFFIDGYNIKTSAYPGQDGGLTFVANITGRFSFRCSVTCGEFHPYMIGYLVVGPNLRFLFYVFLIVASGLTSLFLIFKSKRKKEDGSR